LINVSYFYETINPILGSKFNKFIGFCERLLPHELDYLYKIQQFKDKDRLSILTKIITQQDQGSFHFDDQLDKRKYSHLKNWIEGKLAEIDVDLSLKRLLEAEEAIYTDQINPALEKQLLKSIHKWDHTFFYFSKWYEVVQVFRNYLLIRMRYKEVVLIDQFLETYSSAYLRSQEANQQIQRISEEIIEQYKTHRGDTKKHIDSLSKMYLDSSLDFYNRFQAFVRLIFIGFNYRDFTFLNDHFDSFDQMLSQGKYYSKRILLNYYSNRLLLHSRAREYDEAEKYGYLSIKVKNQDYLFYLNNLIAVLLRRGKYEKAMSELLAAAPEAKESTNFHNKIGYVSFYVETLNRLDKFKNAENYARVFLNAYSAEIFKYRWHIFFTTYLESLLQQQKYSAITKLASQYKLIDKDKAYSTREGYTPIISWYILIANYENGLVEKEAVIKLMSKHMQVMKAAGRAEELPALIKKISTFVPFITNKLKI